MPNADPTDELLAVAPEGVLQPEGGRRLAGIAEGWRRNQMRQAVAVSMALLLVAAAATVFSAPPHEQVVHGASAKPEALPSDDVVRFVQDFMGTISAGVNPDLKSRELKAGAPAANVTLKKCTGKQVSTWCPQQDKCCNGRCAAPGSVCCGDNAICSEGSTCCMDRDGVYACGAKYNKCGGFGSPMEDDDWPNPATPMEWFNRSKHSTDFGKTVVRETPTTTQPLTPQECANRCGLSGSCCGSLCCDLGATCCKSMTGRFSCGGLGSECGSHPGGVPLAKVHSWEEPLGGETVYQSTD